MPMVNLTAKEIHIIVQAIRIASVPNTEGEDLKSHFKNGEINQLRSKLQNVEDV